MAKTIQGKEIIVDNHLDNAIKQGEQLLKVYKDLNKVVKSTATVIKKSAAGADAGTAKGIQKINQEIQKSNEVKKASIQIDNQIIKAEAKLVALDKQRAKELADTRLATQRLNKEARENAILTSKNSTEYEKASVRLNKMRRELKDLALTEDKASNKTKKLAREVTKLDQKLKQADASAGQFQREVGNYKKSLGGAIGSLKRFAGALGVVGGVQLLTRAIRDSFNVIKNFDQAQANLSSVLGVSRESMGELTEQAKDLGATTKFTASQVAELQLEFAKLGFTQSQITAVTEATLSLAAAAGTDLGNAANIVGSTIRGFGLDVSETQRVVDLMANSFSKSSLDIEKFKVAMSAVGPAASTAGFSLERTTALIGTLTNAGIDASTAGTGLRNIFLELTKNGLTFEQAMGKIANASDQNAAALDLFGKRGATLGVILANNQTGVDELTTSLENSGGAAKEMADKQLDTLGGALDILRSAWEGVILEMNEGTGAGEGLKDIIKDLAEALPIIVKGISEVVKAMANFTLAGFKSVKVIIDLVEKIQNGTASFGDFADAIGDIGLNFLKMIPGMEQAINKMRDIAKSLGIIGDETKELTDIQKNSNTVREQSIRIGKELLKQNEDELGDIPILIDALTDENTTRKEKQEIIAKLQKDYPKLLENIDLETASTEQLIQVKKDLIKELFNQAIAQKKAEVQAEITGKILELELQKIGKNANGVAFLNNKIEELTLGLLAVDDVEATLRANLGQTIDALNLESPIGKTSAAISELRIEIAGIEKALKTAKGEEAADLRERLKKKQEELRRFEGERIKILDDGLDRENEINDESVENFKAREDKKVEVVKFTLSRIRKLLNEFEDESKKRNRARIKGFGGEDDDEIITIDEELPGIDDFFGLDEEDLQIEEPLKKAVTDFKKFRDESLAIFKEITDGLIANIDKRIDARKEEIEDSKSEIQRLKDIASQSQGQAAIDAAKSIKAEEIRIAKQIVEIEKLEKKKRNLLITTVALEKASQNIGAGDGNPFKNATASLNNFLEGLPTNFDGTTGTVAQALGHTGVRDGHIVRVHDNEHIIGAKDSDMLHKAGFSKTSDIVSSAMAAQNNAVSYKAMNPNVRLDTGVTDRLDKIEAAVKNFKPVNVIQQHIDIGKGVEVIIDENGNKTTNYHKSKAIII